MSHTSLRAYYHEPEFSIHLQQATLSLLSFFFNTPATTNIYTLSLHDALPIYRKSEYIESLENHLAFIEKQIERLVRLAPTISDRKSTRLNSSHRCISYAVFCLKKKKKLHKYVCRYKYYIKLHSDTFLADRDTY